MITGILPSGKTLHCARSKLIGEYSTVVAAAEDARVAYLTADHLGSPRINTDRDGKVTSRHDYHPYGEEIITAQRTSHEEYTPDSVRKQFTGYERDGESGLDFAQARVYSNVLGRYFSPDPVGPDFYAPQTLNRYPYVLNNPLKFVDRDGRYEEEVHRDLTVVLAYLAGFNPEQSTAIGQANQHIDENPATDPEPPGNVLARAEYHFTTRATRARHWVAFTQHVDAANGDPISALGTFLHAQQDAFSHYGFNFVTGQASSGFKDGIPLSKEEFMQKAREADKTQTNPGKAERMAADTLSRLLQARARMESSRRFGTFGRSVPLRLIKPYIKRWAVASSRQDKKNILQDLIAVANMWRFRQMQQEMEKQKTKTSVRVIK